MEHAKTSSEATILLVDDTPAKLLSYEVMLGGLGARLVKAESAETGFLTLLTTDVALIITDVMMPTVDGFQFAKMVREHPRFARTPIIFVSAIAQSEMDQQLTPADIRDLRRLAGLMIPAAPDYRVPGADDAGIFADIVRSLGRDRNDVRKALAMLRELAGGDFAALADGEAEKTAMTLLRREGPEITALGRVVLQCYYRDDRVMRSLGLEPRAPFPKGHALEQGDWSLLDAVRGRPRMWRDVDGKGS